MDEVREATEALIEEKPGIEDRLRAVLAVDAEADPWTFDDVPLDSGEFGEVVSRGIVEKRGDGYRAADREAIAEAVDVDEPGEAGRLSAPLDTREFDPGEALRGLVPTIDRRVAAYLGLALGVVVFFRIVPYPAVFRGGDVVLSSNDPYAYRFVVEQIATEARGPTDFAVLADLPAYVTHGEPLMVATLWWFTELLGGGADAAGTVLAWYPVGSAVVTGVLLYLLATAATDDERVGIAAVSMLAIMPLHAIRTGLGYADHHAFDYPWLALTALALVLLADRDLRDRRTWRVGAVLGIAVAGQVLAWDNGVLLLVPVGLYAALRATSDVRADRSPLGSGLPLAGGIALASLLVLGVHALLGWHTGTVVAVPVLLFAGVVGTLLLAEANFRLDGSAGGLATLYGFAAVGGLLVVSRMFPSLSSELYRGLDRLFGTEGIAEATPLLGGQFEGLLGPLSLFGFALLLALGYMAWASWRTYRQHEPELLVATTYAWFFFALTTVQLRFGGAFSIFAALFAGLGFVHVASWIDLARVLPVFQGGDSDETSGLQSSGSDEPGTVQLDQPDRRSAMYAAGFWLGLGSLGMVSTATRHSSLTIEKDLYETAKWIAEDAAERGLEYPKNYVLSAWDRTRVYNYFVNGESLRYGYARSNYGPFLRATEPETWYYRLQRRVGYVVLEPDAGDGLASPDSMHLRLTQFGGRSDLASGSGHYRARFRSEGGRIVFELVPGAVIVGTKTVGAETVSTDVDVEGASFTYQRSTRAHGVRNRVRVAYPGRYEVGDRTVRVSEAAVRNGEEIVIG